MQSYLKTNTISTGIQDKKIRLKTCSVMACAVTKKTISVSMSQCKTLVPRMKGFSVFDHHDLWLSISQKCTKGFFFLIEGDCVVLFFKQFQGFVFNEFYLLCLYEPGIPYHSISTISVQE